MWSERKPRCGQKGRVARLEWCGLHGPVERVWFEGVKGIVWMLKMTA